MTKRTPHPRPADAGRAAAAAAAGTTAAAAAAAENLVRRVFGQHMEGAHCRRGVAEVEDPGPPLQAGEDRSVVALEEVIAAADGVPAGAAPDALPAAFVEEAARAQRAVARIVLAEPHAGLPAGGGWGTGFLVSNAVLLTGYHVIPTPAFARRVRVEFNYRLDSGGAPEPVDAFETDPDAFFHADPVLDVALLRLRPKLVRRAAERPQDVRAGWRDASWHPFGGRDPGAAAGGGPDLRPITLMLRYAGMEWGFIPLDDEGLAFAEGQHVNIVQHPRGRRKEVVIGGRNRIEGVYADHLRYATEVEPGASGSPVLDDRWRLLAIHQAAGARHAGAGAAAGLWCGNQAVRADRIVASLRERFAGRPLLAELGLS